MRKFLYLSSAQRFAEAAPDYRFDFPPEVGARYHGQPVLIATSIVNATFNELAKKPLPPRNAQEVSLSAAMKTIGPAFAALRTATGEARRVLIARALVHAPEALVLDEPTTGLDVVARHRFMEQMRQVARNGTTVILVTQHIDEIFPEVGRVIVLDDGRILDDGPKDRVLRGAALAAAFGGPLHVTVEDGYYFVRPLRGRKVKSESEK